MRTVPHTTRPTQLSWPSVLSNVSILPAVQVCKWPSYQKS